LHDHAPRLERLGAVITSLGSMVGCEVRVWRLGRGRLRPVLGCGTHPAPVVHVDIDGKAVPAADGRWVAPVPGVPDLWYELAETPSPDDAARTLAPLLTQLLSAERETLDLAKELAARLEEIELLYTISQVLGQTIRLETATEIIAKEVSAVVGARRASIFVVDDAGEYLRPVAGVGKDVSKLGPIPVTHPTSIAAQVFRSGETKVYDPRSSSEHLLSTESGQHYLGAAYLSVPIMYPAASGELRPVGVINLTNRVGSDLFSDGEQKLVTAVAGQIASAIENARLVQRDLARDRIAHELELAHDLQLKLLPAVSVLGDEVDMAARCLPAESVGGDFYYFVKLPGHRVGVMLGDVSSHGFAAALIMSLVLSAAGIHAAESDSAELTVRRILESVKDELEEAEMHLSLFYAVLDLNENTMEYANAGHPHAFRVQPNGEWERLGATAPPLGLANEVTIDAARASWQSCCDRLVLFTDGVSDGQNEQGERFGEERVLAVVARHPDEPSEAVLDAVLEEFGAFGAAPHDDRTILILRT